jgi:beta-1,4-mannosyltransferase
VAPRFEHHYARLVAPAGSPHRPRGIASLPPSITQNPYQRLLYEHLATQGVYAVDSAELKLPWLWRNRRAVSALHFHWPHAYYQWLWEPRWARRPLSWIRLILFGSRLAASRMLGYRVIWTAHQVYPHETVSRRMDRIAGRMLARTCHAVIAHDYSTAESLHHELGAGADRVRVLAHGSYVGVYADGRDRATTRSALGLGSDTFTFISFGHLRAYKDLALLVRAFRRIDRPDVALVVAGAALDDGSLEAVRTATKSDTRIRLLPNFVPEEGVSELFAASDAAVVARGDGGTSGALVLALSLGVPVVAANQPAYSELLGDGQAGWLFDAGSEQSLAAALVAAASDPEGTARRAVGARAKADTLRWEHHSDCIARVVLDHGGEAEMSYA